MGTRTGSQVSYLMFLVTWLGTPLARCFEGLPHFQARLPQVEAKPWPIQAQTALGTRGCAFLRGLLRFPPLERSMALEHAWFNPERLVLGGRSAPPTEFLPEGIIAKPGLAGGSLEEALASPRGRKRKGGGSSQAKVKLMPAGSGQAKVKPRPVGGSRAELKRFTRRL